LEREVLPLTFEIEAYNKKAKNMEFFLNLHLAPV
jgi:hypothetical protein